MRSASRCPVLGAVVLAAAASLASRLPFVIVRDEAKEYGTANRIEGAFEEGERVCLIEDVVTSGGALARAVGAVREAGLECRTPSVSSTARRAVWTRSRASGYGSIRSIGHHRCSSCKKVPQNRLVEPKALAC